jgi:arabinose-5-phosphate isomerase
VVIAQAKEVLKIEAQSILDLTERIGPEFEKAVAIIVHAKGRVILTGMGKSGLVARKISATLNSTGTSSLFLHPAEAIHGDLGMVTSNDVILAISNSGHTAEINRILPIVKGMGAKIILFTGGLHSPMAMESDVVIDVGVEREACPLGLAPTASTTAALAMGDALAVVLLNQRRFNRDDFRRFHPGGSLGERLCFQVREVMLTDAHIPVVPLGATVADAIREIDAKGIGATLVCGENRRLEGIISDGDLRRALLENKEIDRLKVEEIMSPTPKTIRENETSVDALGQMETHGIMHLVVVDEHTRIKGIVHLHDVLGREGFRINGAMHRAARTHH